MASSDFTKEQLSALDELAWSRAKEVAQRRYGDRAPEIRNAEEFRLAMRYLAEYVSEHPYERSPAATSEAEHYYVCPKCGEAVDMRVLAQVTHHERDGHGRMGRES